MKKLNKKKIIITNKKLNNIANNLKKLTKLTKLKKLIKLIILKS